MEQVRLDASGWICPGDFYDALLPRLGAPDWHGRNLDALRDSIRGGINRLEPPFEVIVSAAWSQSAEMRQFLMQVERLFKDTCDEGAGDVAIRFQPSLTP